MSIFPWHQSAWQRLTDARRSGRLAHAYLIYAPPGFGRDEFARTFVAALLCGQVQADGGACGTCQRCAWVEAQSHPDVLEVHPSGASETIPVDAIREAAGFITLSAMENSWKTVLIFQAERMNGFAANSLLKTLEEPPGQGMVILICDRPGAVLATLRSRCQFIDVGRCGEDVAAAWLAAKLDSGADARLALGLAQGAPLRAIEGAQAERMAMRTQLFENYQALMRGRIAPLSAAAAWMNYDMGVTLGWLRAWYVDMIRLAQAPDARIDNEDVRETLAELARRLAVRRLFVGYDSICQALRLQRTNVNPQLVLEDLLCRLNHTEADGMHSAGAGIAA